jgi:imidazole glycerol-phosphate synthase subunit HisH
VIIDSGGANLASLQFALGRLGAESCVTSRVDEILEAPRVLLPGVGSAPDAMQRLRATGLTEVLLNLTQPVLGICLGMQLLFASSDEGSTACLGVLDEDVRRIQRARGRPVPHMGWSRMQTLRPDPLTEGLEPTDYVYFVHSYAAPVNAATVASFEYGRAWSAVVQARNFWGVQFHPERSGRCGARILRNFMGLAS